MRTLMQACIQIPNYKCPFTTNIVYYVYVVINVVIYNCYIESITVYYKHLWDYGVSFYFNI